MIDLDGAVDAVTMDTIAARALAVAGDDAEIHFGRRAIPMLGMSCPRCHVVTSALLRFLPVAATMRRCDCGSPLVPLATRNRVSARELASSDAAAVTLRALGGAPGDELLVVGSRGAARLRTTFAWKEIE